MAQELWKATIFDNTNKVEKQQNKKKKKQKNKNKKKKTKKKTKKKNKKTKKKKNKKTKKETKIQNSSKKIQKYIFKVQTLLRSRSLNINRPCLGHSSPLFNACLYNHIEILSLLLADNRLDVNLQPLGGGFTALH